MYFVLQAPSQQQLQVHSACHVHVGTTLNPLDPLRAFSAVQELQLMLGPIRLLSVRCFFHQVFRLGLGLQEEALPQ